LEKEFAQPLKNCGLTFCSCVSGVDISGAKKTFSLSFGGDPIKKSIQFRKFIYQRSVICQWWRKK